MDEIPTVKCESVYFLIVELCESLARQYECQKDGKLSTGIRKRLKARAHEVLLKKSQSNKRIAHQIKKGEVYIGDFRNEAGTEHQDVLGDGAFDAERAFAQHIFAEKLCLHRRQQHRSDFEAEQRNLTKLERHVLEIFSNTNTDVKSSKIINQICQLLLALQSSSLDLSLPANDQTNAQENLLDSNAHNSILLVPSSFTIHGNYAHNTHYMPTTATTSTIQRIMQPKPQFFTGIKEIHCGKNPYLPKSEIFDGTSKNKHTSNQLLYEIEQKYDLCKMRMQAKCSKRLQSIQAAPFRLYPELRLNLDAPAALSVAKKPENLKEKSKTIKENSSANVEDDKSNEIFSWNWENLACPNVLKAIPFACENSVAYDLMGQHYNNTPRQDGANGSLQAKFVKYADFLNDLKSLIVGIQSECFWHDEYIIFHMQPNLTIDGLLPQTMAGCMSRFLECGTCFKRLKMMIMKKNYRLMFEGFIFKALCMAVDEYLLTFHQFVYAHVDTNFMAFYQRLQCNMMQVINLSYTLAIHPEVNASIKPPLGSQFLGYLYREIMRLTEPEYLTLLIFLLKRCCHVYFKHLQKWIYYGVLDDPSNELFICFLDHYRPNTKYFYEKAYFVRKESVPGFFQSHENQILECGKYTMLLKAFKPNHPLFHMEYPPMSVCLSFEDIEKLETNCRKYYQLARESCGKPITIRDIFEARTQEKRAFCQMAGQCTKANMEKWLGEQRLQAQRIAEQKKKRHEQLTIQLQDDKQRKFNERRANVELELKILREAEKLNDSMLVATNINLRKRIEYYQELSNLMNDQLNTNAANGGVSGSGGESSKVPTISLINAEGTEITMQHPHTPSSIVGTDFESCDDEDAPSEYAECISDDFVQHFVESEMELNRRYNFLSVLKPEDSNAAVAEEEISNNNQGEEQVHDDVGGGNEEQRCLKRSISDVLNSNDLLQPIAQKALENRKQVMSGSEMALCMQQSTTAATIKCNNNNNTKQQTVAMTEAERNKLKVMNEEFGLYNPNCMLPSSDINLNSMPQNDGALSEAQRNRKRMMENDNPFVELYKDPFVDRSHLHLDLNTDRARNRRKVLESEFNIVTGTKTISTTTFDVIGTPMSTTSDPSLSEMLTHSEKDPETESNKCCLPATQPPPSVPLKLEITERTEALPENAPIDTAQIVLETPMSALNTKGLMAQQGFDFTDPLKSHDPAADEVPIQNDQLTADATNEKENYNNLQQDYSEPYKRCIELIESNFQCPTRSPYVQLQKLPLSGQKMRNVSKATAGIGNVNDTGNEDDNKRLIPLDSMNSMNAITLTEFLQQSVIKPMSVHLNLLNSEIMRMFIDDLRLLDHFRSLRHYFFLMNGEFGAKICDGILEQLDGDGSAASGANPQKLLNYQILHSILDTALGSSTLGANCKNTEQLSFIVKEIPEHFDLTSPSVLQSLSLSYHVEWPLNIILSPDILEHYSNIFCYLIKVRRISWLLERAYQQLKEELKINGKHLLRSPHYCHIQLIRHKFYHFVHSLQNHITANALQSSWKTFKDDLLHVNSIREICKKHVAYLKKILLLCMLNRRSIEFHNTIEKIFKIALHFYNIIKTGEFQLVSNINNVDEIASVHYIHTQYAELTNDEREFDHLIKHTIVLAEKIVRHGDQTEIGEFINLINYNQYYNT